MRDQSSWHVSPEESQNVVTVGKLGSFLENWHMTQQAHPWAYILESENLDSHKNLLLNVYSGSSQSLQNLEFWRMPSSG